MQGQLTTNQLGFINCDRFPNEPMQILALDTDPNIKAEYYLVFSDVRGVMTGYLSNNKASFGSVPTNRTGTLVAVSFMDDKAYFFSTKVTAGSGQLPTIKLKEVPESYVDEQLAQLN